MKTATKTRKTTFTRPYHLWRYTDGKLEAMFDAGEIRFASERAGALLEVVRAGLLCKRSTQLYTRHSTGFELYFFPFTIRLTRDCVASNFRAISHCDTPRDQSRFISAISSSVYRDRLGVYRLTDR